jgi:hypothetical protein
MSSYQGGPRKTGGGWSKQQQGNRRPNNYWQSSSSSSANASQKFGLREGQTGLFFTIDGDPARAIREARRLLDEFVVDKNVVQIQSGKQQDAAGPKHEIVTAKEEVEAKRFILCSS